MPTFSESERVYFRGVVANALEQKTVPVAVEVDVDGYLRFVSVEWNAYWRESLGFAAAELNDLKKNWGAYIDSRFSLSRRVAYCRAYYRLLDRTLALLARQPDVPELRATLSSCVSFESFELRSAIPGVGGAGTSSLRNPNYLLGKLRVPDALDDVRFLPLLMVRRNGRACVFYSYRQHVIDSVSGHSILLYLPTEVRNRKAAFATLCTLERMIAENGDARVTERANRLATRIIVPFLQSRRGLNQSRPLDLELIDIGAGSGALAAAIFRQMRGGGTVDQSPSGNLGVRLVDVLQPEMQRFWNGSKDSGVHYVMAFVEDFRRWCDGHSVSGESNRIVLISQLFNNQSTFSIRQLDPALVLKTSGTKDDLRKHSPLACLGGSSQDVRNLLVSPVPVNLAEGRTFCQISLSPYFHALSLAGQSMSCKQVSSGVFLPVRSFDTRCLFSENGRAILPMLLEYCCLVIVHDADLRRHHILEHASFRKDGRFVALDITRMLKLRGNRCFVFARRGECGLQALEGENLW